jgi:transcriptional regulator with GAF, ATPase, and Fis domain
MAREIMDDEKHLVHRAEEFLQLFKKGAEFTQELLKENERLRYRVLELEQLGPSHLALHGSGSSGNDDLLVRNRVLEQEKADILARIQQIESENADFALRYVEVEQENNNLANLYIASYQLHSTLDFQEVLQIIIEITINLIGAEEFALMLLDDKSGELQPVAAEGIELADIAPIPAGEGIVGKAAVSGEDYFAMQPPSIATFLQPLVCIPLKIKDDVIGVLVITKLLQQKISFAPVDYELFTLLAAHAATAIFAARLYTAAERKLTTIQGFLDLLTRKV